MYKTFKELVENELNKSDRSDYDKSDHSQAKKVHEYKNYEILQDKDKFFLFKDGDYKAELINYEDKIKYRIINVIYAFSEERGAYKILLLGLLNYNKVSKIISDSILSLSAEKFWRKICIDDSIKKIAVDINDNIINIKNSEEAIKYLEDINYRIGVK